MPPFKRKAAVMINADTSELLIGVSGRAQRSLIADLNRAPEAVWFESRRHGALIGLGIVACFRLGGRDISDRFEQATIVEPVDPFESGEFYRLGTASRAATVDHLGLEQAVDAFGERVVVTVADAADGRFDPSFKQALAVTDREVLHAAVAVVHEAALADRTAIAQRLLERVQHEVCAG